MSENEPKKKFSFNDAFNDLTSFLTGHRANKDGAGPEGDNPRSKSIGLFRFKRFLSVVGASLICGFIGVAIGFLLMLTNPAYFQQGFKSFWDTGFANLDKVVYIAGPLLLCALSVGFCYKCGLFNIGASGQFTMGGMTAIIATLYFRMPWYASCCFAILAGAMVGSIPGLLKAFFNINEVITAIMLNWIVLFTCDVLFQNIPGVTDPVGNKTKAIPSALSLPSLPGFYLNVTIIIGLVMAFLLAFVLYKTTFGYKLRSVGFNRDAAKYAGISDKKNIIIAFIVAGALAGLGGACYYLLGTVQFTLSKDTVASQGFDAIPIALLANNNPIGIIFSALFIAFIKVAGNGLQGIGTYNDEFVDIMISIILYLSGFATLFVNFFLENRRKRKKEGQSPPPVILFISSSASRFAGFFKKLFRLKEKGREPATPDLPKGDN
jgi:simple sugar transport system permease protein